MPFLFVLGLFSMVFDVEAQIMQLQESRETLNSNLEARMEALHVPWLLVLGPMHAVTRQV